MSVQHQLLLLLGLTAVLHTADARGHDYLASAPSPQTLPHLIHGQHHHGVAAPPQALPVFHHGHHILGHGHHRHGIADAPKAHPVNILLLEDMCKLANNPDGCIAVSRHYAHAFPTIDNLGLLDMLITGAIDGAHAAAIESAKIAADANTPAPVANNLVECLGGFTGAEANLKQVKDAVAKRDEGTVMTYLSLSLDNVGRCNDIFVERPTAEKNPMANDAKLLADITSSSLAVAGLALGSPN